eukprot:1860863-Rhodomonas_salina.1
MSVGEETTGSKKRVTWEQEGGSTDAKGLRAKRKAQEAFLDVDMHEEERIKMLKSDVEIEDGKKNSGPGRSEVVESALVLMMRQMQASTEALLAKAPAAAKDDGKPPASDKD